MLVVSTEWNSPALSSALPSLLASLCNRTSLLASCAIDSYLWPWHPASTHGITGSGSTAPSPSTVDAEHLCSGGAPKSSLAHGVGAEGSLVWHTVAQRHPDWHYKGLGIKRRGASVTRFPFKVLREALAVQAETLLASQCSAGTAALSLDLDQNLTAPHFLKPEYGRVFSYLYDHCPSMY